MHKPLLAGLLSLIVAGMGGASAQDVSSTEFRKLHDEYFASCMQAWDAATHMTKQDWASTCRRLAKERVKYRLEHSPGFLPKAKK
jgi:hypothetical protein